MNTFLVVAAIMAAIAAAAVATPLLRDRQSRVVGGVAGLLVIGAAAGLYPLWSNWDWHALPPAHVTSPDIAAMVSKLEQRLRTQPNDLAGWAMLGRSYLALERMDDAVEAYQHAHRLDPKDVDVALGLGEAISLRAGGNIPPPASELFEQAVALAPDNPKALLYAGFAAAARGDDAVARSRWQALKALHPPPQIEAMLDARIAELGPAAGAGGGGPGGGGAQGGGGMAGAGGPGGSGAQGSAVPGVASGAGAGAPGAAAGTAEATVNIRISPALKSRLTAETPLFVFARDPGAQGPPLAAKRLTSAAIGSEIHLSAADSMMPGRVLTSGRRVSITARVSFSGQPLPATGDLYGELSYDVGRDGVRDLVIDRVAE